VCVYVFLEISPRSCACQTSAVQLNYIPSLVLFNIDIKLPSNNEHFMFILCETNGGPLC
jgi:hypothetical protein